MIKDNCLIIENVVSDIKLTQEKGSNVFAFEGTFTVFDIMNENGRYYRKDQFMPFVDKLQPIIEKKKLLGELDHPNDFSVKLDRASHIIEKLELDEENNRIVGKIRLLDTEKGKNARAIAEAGVPLHISSRASGRVMENGDVQINQLYTYDLVADPGFKEAQLHKVNENISTERVSEIRLLVESLNNFDFSHEGNKLTLIKEDKGMKVYQIEEEKAEPIIPTINKIEENQDMSDFVKLDAMQKWAADVVNAMHKLQEKFEVLETKIEDKKEHTVTETKYEIVKKEDNFQLVSEGNVVFESAEEDEVYEKLEELDKRSILVEFKKLRDEFNEKLTLQNEYLDYLKENVENVGTYAEVHLKENIEQIADYSQTYLREQIENIANYSEGYLKENIETIANYSGTYLKTQIENIGTYAEGHLKESIENLAISTKIEENTENGTNPQINNKNVVVESVSITDYKTQLQDKIKAIQESTKKQNDDANSSEAKVNEENANTEPKEEDKPLFVFMPADRKEKWNKLSEGRKNEILEYSKNYVVESQAQVETFWYNYCILDEALMPAQDDKKLIAESTSRNTRDLSEYGLNVDDLIRAFKG